ncbi:hypothetical protein C2845_PM13G08940 [Panicum miliaceum]|uniref:Uncharacterized protein n=1 Tax=Panicum miliaceum TaxID=4540 RepID=A0A3L6RKU6_PANMI|nr:hypothetical protein C2845_PM13G08940 [Panicum miliaceum]
MTHLTNTSEAPHRSKMSSSGSTYIPWNKVRAQVPQGIQVPMCFCGSLCKLMESKVLGDDFGMSGWTRSPHSKIKTGLNEKQGGLEKGGSECCTRNRKRRSIPRYCNSQKGLSMAYLPRTIVLDESRMLAEQ